MYVRVSCAGALHDHKRAVLIGEKTFGKGVVQYFFPMGDGSGLKLTVAKYLTPKMYDITKHGGLAPDITCKDYPRGKQDTHGSCPTSPPATDALLGTGSYVIVVSLSSSFTV